MTWAKHFEERPAMAPRAYGSTTSYGLTTTYPRGYDMGSIKRGRSKPSSKDSTAQDILDLIIAHDSDAAQALLSEYIDERARGENDTRASMNKLAGLQPYSAGTGYHEDDEPMNEWGSVSNYDGEYDRRKRGKEVLRIRRETGDYTYGLETNKPKSLWRPGEPKLPDPIGPTPPMPGVLQAKKEGTLAKITKIIFSSDTRKL